MSKLYESPKTYLYDGTLEGLLTCVFHAYAAHEAPEAIVESGALQLSFYTTIEKVETDISLASRVRTGLVEAGGIDAYNSFKKLFLHGDAADGRLALDYVRLVMEHKRKVFFMLADPTIAAVEKVRVALDYECENMRQFVRFEELEGGVFYARIEPRFKVVPLLEHHFVSRFNTQPFIIHDAAHDMAGVYDGASWTLVVSDEINLPDYASGELQYQHLWKTFYDALSNEKRYNPSLRTSLMPQRFWKNLTEFKTIVSAPALR